MAFHKGLNGPFFIGPTIQSKLSEWQVIVNGDDGPVHYSRVGREKKKKKGGQERIFGVS